MYFVTVSMLFSPRKDGGRSKASPTVLDGCSVGNGVQGRRRRIKQNQGLLHINHTAVQLLSTLYNLTIYSSLCSWCACVRLFVCILSSFFSSPRLIHSKTCTQFMLWVTLGRVTFHVATLLTQDYAAGPASLELSLCVFIARRCCCSRTFSWLSFGQPLALMRRCRTGCWAPYGTSFHYSWHSHAHTHKTTTTAKADLILRLVLHK